MTGPTINKATQFSSRHGGSVFGHMNKTAIFCTFCQSSWFSEYFELSHLVRPSHQNLCFGVMMKGPTKIQTDKTYYPGKILLPLAANISRNYLKSKS